MVVALGDGVLLTAIRVDLRRLHDGWMGLVFPRQRIAPHNVLGRWRPQTLSGRLSYWIWYLIGAPLVLALYPPLLAGFAVRFQAHKLDNMATRIGILGVVLLSLVVWGVLSLVAFVRLPIEGFVAVLAAGIVATTSAALAFVLARVGGRGTTIALAYPFGVNAIFLPPVVAAFYSPWLAQVIFPGSERLAIWILANLFEPVGLRWVINAYFDLTGVAYAGMWFAIAVPVGWVLGLLVALADLVRPKRSNKGSVDRGESTAD